MDDSDKGDFRPLLLCGHPFGGEPPQEVETAYSLWTRALMTFFRMRAPDECEPLVNEALMEIIKSYHRFPATTQDARRYAWGIAKHILSKWYAGKKRKQHEVALDEIESGSYHVLPPVSLDTLAVAEWWRKICRKIGRSDCSFATDAFAHGFNSEELARKYGLTAEAARQRKSRLKRSLLEHAKGTFGEHVPFNLAR